MKTKTEFTRLEIIMVVVMVATSVVLTVSSLRGCEESMQTEGVSFQNYEASAD